MYLHFSSLERSDHTATSRRDIRLLSDFGFRRSANIGSVLLLKPDTRKLTVRAQEQCRQLNYHSLFLLALVTNRNVESIVTLQNKYHRTRLWRTIQEDTLSNPEL